MNAFTKRFAKRLREIRVHYSEMTQEELAMASGLSVMQISHYETGRRLPSLQNYAALVKALDANAAYMIGLSKYDPHRTRIKS